MIWVIVIGYVVAAILPTLVRDWKSWLFMSSLSALPTLLAVAALVGSGDDDAGWVVILFVFPSLYALAVGMGAGLFRIVGTYRGWGYATSAVPTMVAGVLMVLPVAFMIGIVSF
ncbi:MAG: hypothetical protein AAF674_20280 [Pseudomonadota bacterium]